MSEVLYRATKYMNAKDVLSVREEKPKKRERQDDTRQDQGRKKAPTGRTVPQAPGGKVYELHPTNGLNRSSSDVDQRRGSPDLPQKAEGRS